MWVGVGHLNGHITIVTITGRLDRAEKEYCPDHVYALEKKEKQRVVFDITNVTNLDSFGTGQMVKCQENVEASGGRCCWIVNKDRENVMNVLERTGLLKVFEICESITDGFKFFKLGQ